MLFRPKNITRSMEVNHVQFVTYHTFCLNFVVFFSTAWRLQYTLHFSDVHKTLPFTDIHFALLAFIVFGITIPRDITHLDCPLFVYDCHMSSMKLNGTTHFGPSKDVLYSYTPKRDININDCLLSCHEFAMSGRVRF